MYVTRCMNCAARIMFSPEKQQQKTKKQCMIYMIWILICLKLVKPQNSHIFLCRLTSMSEKNEKG